MFDTGPSGLNLVLRYVDHGVPVETQCYANNWIMFLRHDTNEYRWDRLHVGLWPGSPTADSPVHAAGDFHLLVLVVTERGYDGVDAEAQVYMDAWVNVFINGQYLDGYHVERVASP
jgi:hypothetical protein